MKMFATLSSKALKVVIDNKYVSNATAPDAATNTPMSVTPVDSAVMRVCRMIERSTYIAEKENMTNCGMKDFPWLKELVPFAVHLTRDCRVRIASGFQTGLFTASDKTSQAALMQALIIAGPLEPKGPTNSITPKSILKTSLPQQTTEVPSHQSRSNSPSPVIGTPPVLAATTSSPYNHRYVVHSMNFIGIMLITKLVHHLWLPGSVIIRNMMHINYYMRLSLFQNILNDVTLRTPKPRSCPTVIYTPYRMSGSQSMRLFVLPGIRRIILHYVHYMIISLGIPPS
jgi:hypothetical protein